MAINLNLFPFNNLNDHDLRTVLNEFNHQYPLSVIKNITFDKFNFDDSSNDYHIVREPLCDYYFCDDFVKRRFSDHSLKLLSFNIASVPLHFD